MSFLPSFGELWAFARTRVLPLAWPMLTNQFIVVGSVFLSMIMLSHLGHAVLAASALIFSTQVSCMVLGMSILFSLSIFIGRAFGAGQHAEIGHYVRQGWLMAMVISIPVIIFFLNSGRILMACGQTVQNATLVQSYFYGYAWGAMPLFLSVVNQQFCFAIHRQKFVILTGVCGVIVLLFTANGMIFGHFGMPKLGVRGFGYAMAIQNWFSLLFMWIRFHRNPAFKIFRLFSGSLRPEWKRLKQIFIVGWPICVQSGGEMTSFFVSAAMVGWLGQHALAAYQITVQYFSLIIIPMLAISMSSGILVGQAFGAKKFSEIHHIGYASVGLMLMVSVIIAVILLLLPRELISAYLNLHDPEMQETIHIAVILFALTAVFQIGDGVRNVLTGALRGLLDTRFPMYAGLATIWLVGIPLGYFFAFHLHFGAPGISLGSGIGMLIGMLIVWMRWRHRSRAHQLL